MAKIKIAELDINTDALIKATADVKKEIDSLKQSQKELTKNGETSSKQFVKNSADLKALSSAYNNNIKALSSNTQATADQANRSKILALTIDQEATSIKGAREQNKALNKLRNEANATTTKGQAEIQKLNNKLDANNEFIKENSDQYLKQKINIGNYQGALSGVSPKLAGILTQIQGTIGGLQAQKAALVGTTSSLGGTSKALKIFRLALISTGIGALVVAFGSLITFLATTQAGMDKLTAITRPLQAVFQSLLGVVQNVGESLFNAVTKPKQLLADLVDFVKGQVINRFKAFGVILEAIANRDFKALANGVLQAATGVTDLTDKVSKAGKDSAKFFADAAAKGAEIDRITKEIETKEINIAKQRQKSINDIKELEKITKDTSATTEARLEANQKQNELARRQVELEKGIINLKKDRLIIEQDLNDTNREGNKELQELNAQLLAQDGKITEEELKGIRVVATARKEQQKNREKAIDNAIKKQKEELDLFVAQQGTRAKTLEEEVALATRVSADKIKILERELKAGKISQAKFDKESIDARTELLNAQTNLTISNAEREVSAHEGLNTSKLDSDVFYTDQSIQLEKDRLDSIAESQREFEAVRLAEGVINQTEYNDAINLIDDENRLKLSEADLLREEALKEKQLIDLENKRLLDEEKFTTDFDLATERERLRYEAEIRAAEKSGADTTLIDQKHTLNKKKINAALQESKIASLGATFGIVSDILGKETAAGKAAALAQALINTYQGISAGVALGYPAAIPAVLAASVAGFGAVKKITSTSTKFEAGGLQEIGGARHSGGGTKFQGEDGTQFEAEQGELIGVMNRNAARHFMDFNNSFPNGGSTPTFFEGGGIVARSVSSQGVDMNELARITQQAVAELPAPIVTVEDINAGQGGVAEVVSGADM